VELSDAVVEVTGDLAGEVTTSAVYNRSTVPPGQDARVRVTLTGTDDIVEGKTGLVTIHVEGTSIAP
jgi:hypothetical protein